MLYTWRQVGMVVVLVVVGILAWRFYDHAYQAGVRDCAAAQTALADAAAADARAAAQAQSQRAAAEARAVAAARFDQLSRRHALDRDITRRAVPADCGLDADALELLNSAVRAGNGTAPTTPDSMPNDMPAGPGTD